VGGLGENVCKAGLCTGGGAETAGGGTGGCLGGVGDCSALLRRGAGPVEVVGGGVDWAGLLRSALLGAGEASGLEELLLLVLGFKFFFWNSACIFHSPLSSLLSSAALLDTPAGLAAPCLLCRSLILLVIEARPASPNEGAGEGSWEATLWVRGREVGLGVKGLWLDWILFVHGVVEILGRTGSGGELSWPWVGWVSALGLGVGSGWGGGGLGVRDLSSTFWGVFGSGCLGVGEG